MKKVIDAELARIANPAKKDIGLEPVDLKWAEFAALRGNPAARADPFIPKMSFGGKWLKNIDPMQGTLMANYWGMPEAVWRRLASEVTEKADKEELMKRGLNPRSAK
jgi:hypothetical protein